MLSRRFLAGTLASMLVIGVMLTGCEGPLQFGSRASLSVGESTPQATPQSVSSPVINEFVFNHAGSDTFEYVEVKGEPSTDYSGLTLLEIEGDSSSPGTIDGVFAVGMTDAFGYWTTGFLSNEIENGTVTMVLVDSFTGADGDDLDADDDGFMDAAPWVAIVDSVAVTDGGSGDRTYSTVVLGPGFDGTAFTPGGASRIPDGADTDSSADWVRNSFALAGLPTYAIEPAPGEAYNTPGASNAVVADEPALELTIPQIQGAGQVSDYAEETVITTGVVTLISVDGRGFWMQDPDGDGDPSTSDGIYVFRGGNLTTVAIGDLVEVEGVVLEYRPGGPSSLSLTEISPVNTVTILESGQPLPESVELTMMPDYSIPDSIAYYEALEGMLVAVADGRVVGPTSRFGEFVIVGPEDAIPGSGYQPSRSQILITSDGAGNVDYNPERIIVDDATLDDPVVVAPGDIVSALVGVIDYSYGNYKVQPADLEVEYTGRNRNGNLSIPRSANDVHIATFNVENLFDLVYEPGKADAGSTSTASELETKLTKITLAVIDELRLPDIIVAQEVENQAILQELGDRVNESTGTDYEARSYETSDARGIEVGFLYDRNRVTLVEAHQLSGADVEAAFGPSSDSPGREPIVGVFDAGGSRITIVGNHFKSKGGDDPLYGANWPPVRATEEQRKLQARVVRDFVNTILAGDPEAMVIVTGDLNDFQFGEPGEGEDHPIAILEGFGDEVQFTNMIDSIREAERFTYIFEGNSQVLDHMLVSPAIIAQRPRADIVHFNASAPAVLAGDPTTARRSSDHDPVVMSLRLRERGGRPF